MNSETHEMRRCVVTLFGWPSLGFMRVRLWPSDGPDHWTFWQVLITPWLSIGLPSIHLGKK